MGEEPSSYNDEEIVGGNLVFCLLVLHGIWYQFCSCKRSAFIWRKTSGTWASSVCYCYRWCSWNVSSFWSNALDSSTWFSWQGWKKLNGFLKSAHIMRCKFERQIDNNSFSFLFSFFFFSRVQQWLWYSLLQLQHWETTPVMRTMLPRRNLRYWYAVWIFACRLHFGNIKHLLSLLKILHFPFQLLYHEVSAVERCF